MRITTPFVVYYVVLFLFKNLTSENGLVLAKTVFLDDDNSNIIQDGREKKPFCNAFTGCGRKRSDEMVMADMNPLQPVIEEVRRLISDDSKFLRALQRAQFKSNENNVEKNDEGWSGLNRLYNSDRQLLDKYNRKKRCARQLSTDGKKKAC